MGAEQTRLALQGAENSQDNDVGFDFLIEQMETELVPERKQKTDKAARTIQLHFRRRSKDLKRRHAMNREKNTDDGGIRVKDTSKDGLGGKSSSFNQKQRHVYRSKPSYKVKKRIRPRCF